MPYYVVNTGRGRSTHIMKSNSPNTPNPMSPGSIAAQLIWFGGNPKHSLCGLQATRYVNVFTPSEASCRECKKRWQLAIAAEAAKPQRQPAQAPGKKASTAMGCLGLIVILLVVGGIITGIVLAVSKADRDTGQPAKGMLARVPGCTVTSATGALSIGDLGSNEASEAICVLPDAATVTLATWGSTNPQADDPSLDTQNQEQGVYDDIQFNASPPDCCIIGNSPTAWAASIDNGGQSDWSTVEQALGGQAVTSAPASWNPGP